jgi:hypothetical protein
MVDRAVNELLIGKMNLKKTPQMVVSFSNNCSVPELEFCKNQNGRNEILGTFNPVPVCSRMLIKKNSYHYVHLI